MSRLYIKIHIFYMHTYKNICIWTVFTVWITKYIINNKQVININIIQILSENSVSSFSN